MRSNAATISGYDYVDTDDPVLFSERLARPHPTLRDRGISHFAVNDAPALWNIAGDSESFAIPYHDFVIYNKLEASLRKKSTHANEAATIANTKAYQMLSSEIIGVICLGLGLIGAALFVISIIEGIYSFILPTGFFSLVFLSIAFTAIYIRKTMKKSWRAQQLQATVR